MTEKLRIKPQERLLSLDTLRGLDMLLLVGLTGLIKTICDKFDFAGDDWLFDQMLHVGWEGFRIHDFIFPFFIFLSGVSIPYSISSKLEKGVAKIELLKKISIRMFLLAGLGIIYNGATEKGFSDARFASVLGQIGISYFIAALVFIYSKEFKTKLYWLAGLILSISILQLFVPVPGHGSGTFERATSINAWFDSILTPGRLHGTDYDPEGFLCVISAASITIMGAFIGYIVRSFDMKGEKKSMIIALVGLSLIVLSLLLSPVYPMIKKMWTIPFNLLTAGIGSLLFAIFYFIIDVKGFKKWTLLFSVFGMNSITIYLLCKFVSFGRISNGLFGWIAIPFGEYSGIIIGIGVIIVQWALLYMMYKKKIFLRV